ncbi:hypothetical protein PNEG_00631 [Pneumocystis murina B123]|uniref:BIR-domain-containing protein n=1 Tax=Pneumocystis murina (strain B123) TaxID=1069680 RepID=M7NQM9_PNEMU|nr:hypothetical protein PNEG_00631 [Pneumocystis murina B123]EMR11033.1 hypothetical protein PNEG_00631 [Pneumocystis murina B123]
MEVYASRLASFQLSSRKKLKWPHIRPTPKDLAEAGFYYDPSSSSHDNVVCFLCKKALDGWNANDNPVKEHIEHSRQCGWAILKYIKLCDKERNFFSEKELQDAREATFGHWWPHEQKRGWFSKVKKMSNAGFYYSPTLDSNDMVSCIYCGLGLDGWEPKDDPMEEHKKRAPSCFFFHQSTTTRLKVSEFKASSDKVKQNLDVQNDDSLDGDDSILISKSKTNSSKTKRRSIVKRSSKKSKDNNVQPRLKKPLSVSHKDDYDSSHEAFLLSAIDDKLVLDKSNLIEEKNDENNSNNIDNFCSYKETCSSFSHTNSPFGNSEFPFAGKEIIKTSKLKNTRQSQQIKKENDLNKLSFDNKHKYNTNINTNATKIQKNASIIENNKQNDLSMRSNKRLTRLGVKNDIFESYDSEGSQNGCILAKTTSNKFHRKTSFVKSAKSGEKMSLRGMKLSYDNEEKLVSESENQKIKKSFLRPRKLSRVNTQTDELEDQIISTKDSDIKKKTRLNRKTNEIVNFKELKNASKLTSKLSEVIPLQSVNKGNNYEENGDSFNRNEIFNNFVVKDSFDDSLQQKSKRIFDFDILESETKKAKDISISEIFNNNTDKKTCNWIPIDVEALVFNSSSDILANSHELTVAELDMTIEEWMKSIIQKQVEKLEIECQRMISILKKEGERAKQAILSIQEL